MTVITHPRRQSRLSRMIDKAGGVSVGVALAQARANLALLRPQALQEVSRHIEALAAVPAPVDPRDAVGRLEQVYRAAQGVIDAGHPFDLGDLCAVSLSLCDIVDSASAALEAGGRDIDWRVIRVHAQAMRLLLNLPEDAQVERDQIRAQLAHMVARKFAQAG